MDWTHADAWMPTWPILRTKHHCRTGLYDVETGLTHRYIHVKQTSCAGHRQMCLPTAQILCSAKQQVLFGCTVMNNGVQAPNSDALKRTIGLFNLVCPLGTSSRKFSTSDATVWNWPGTSSPDFAPPFFFWSAARLSTRPALSAPSKIEEKSSSARHSIRKLRRLMHCLNKFNECRQIEKNPVKGNDKCRLLPRLIW